MADNLEKRTGHKTKFQHETQFHDMSDEEYDALDELLTCTNPDLTGIPGIFASQRTLLGLLDTVNANYIQTHAEAAVDRQSIMKYI
jgi:succinate dehydrogenase flavin-adding protein (antitoxin of CptAB toxin-antitoxin module)